MAIPSLCNRWRNTKASWIPIPIITSQPSISRSLVVIAARAVSPTCRASLKSYFQQRQDVNHSQKIMYYFPPAKLPVLTTLATAIRRLQLWHASIPGPTICGNAFAHYGTSFGQAGMDVFYLGKQYLSIYERMINATPARTAKIYYYDQASSTIEVVNLLQHQPPSCLVLTSQFLDDCKSGNLPQYSFVEPSYTDHHDGDNGERVGFRPASRPRCSRPARCSSPPSTTPFAREISNCGRPRRCWWCTTSTAASLITSFPRSACRTASSPMARTPARGRSSSSTASESRVPAILISPYVPKGTVVDGRVFEHACIPNTVTKFFLGDYDQRSPQEKASRTFLDLLSLDAPRTDSIIFSTP